MRRFCLCVVILPCLLFSCRRSQEAAAVTSTETAPPFAAPFAIVQAGEFPLWFQFTDNGPMVIETIEDAVFSAALVPWPLAPHVRFMLAQEEDIMMAVNRDGFLRFSPWKDEAASIGLYRFSGGYFWRQYTVEAFALFDRASTGLYTKPLALLYDDDRFLDSGAPLPSPRLWTFDPFSGGLQSVSLPALDAWPPEDGWDINAFRRGADGYWYFRAVKKTTPPEMHMLRADVLDKEGEAVSLGTFQNAALPEPLSAAPSSLREMLAAVFAESGSGIAAVVSTNFQVIRTFAVDREKPAVVGYYSDEGFHSGRQNAPSFLLALEPQGSAFYVETGAAPSIRRFSLPLLPEGFAYTGIGMCKDTIIATWEEQAGYSIGAAGFMVLRHSLPLLK